MKETPIEEIKHGDEVLCVDDLGNIELAHIVYTDFFDAESRILTKVTLSSGKSVTTTGHHMLSVFVDGKLKLQRADQIVVNQIFLSIGEEVREDRVVNVEQVES